jgi:hypothetical protein
MATARADNGHRQDIQTDAELEAKGEEKYTTPVEKMEGTAPPRTKKKLALHLTLRRPW